jgi:hypothetical protein
MLTIYNAFILFHLHFNTIICLYYIQDILVDIELRKIFIRCYKTAIFNAQEKAEDARIMYRTMNSKSNGTDSSSGSNSAGASSSESRTNVKIFPLMIRVYNSTINVNQGGNSAQQFEQDTNDVYIEYPINLASSGSASLVQQIKRAMKKENLHATEADGSKVFPVICAYFPITLRNKIKQRDENIMLSSSHGHESVEDLESHINGMLCTLVERLEQLNITEKNQKPATRVLLICTKGIQSFAQRSQDQHPPTGNGKANEPPPTGISKIVFCFHPQCVHGIPHVRHPSSASSGSQMAPSVDLPYSDYPISLETLMEMGETSRRTNALKFGTESISSNTHVAYECDAITKQLPTINPTAAGVNPPSKANAISYFFPTNSAPMVGPEALTSKDNEGLLRVPRQTIYLTICTEQDLNASDPIPGVHGSGLGINTILVTAKKKESLLQQQLLRTSRIPRGKHYVHFIISPHIIDCQL